MKKNYLLLLFALFLAGCLKCPDDYVAPEIIKAPPVLSAFINANEVTLNWSFTPKEEDEFKIERKIKDAAFKLIDSTSIDIHSYKDTFLLPETNYTYRIFVVDNKIKCSDYSNEISFTTGN